MEKISSNVTNQEKVQESIEMPEGFTDAARAESLNSVVMQLKHTPSREWLERSLYSFLTNRVSTVEVKSLEKNLNSYNGSEKYGLSLRQLAQTAASSNIPADNDIAWFSFTGNKNAPKKRVRMSKVIAGESVGVAISRKEYFSAPVGSGSPETVISRIGDFQKALLGLAEELGRFSIEKGDRVSFKTPGNLQYFIKHPDSLVVHYGNSENSADIREIVTRHLSAIGMSPTRDGRAETGFDFKSENELFSGSHSSLMSSVVAESMVRAVKEKPELAHAEPVQIQAFLDLKFAEVGAYSPEEMLAHLEAIYTTEKRV